MSGRTLSGAGIRISALERKPRKRLDPRESPALLLHFAEQGYVLKRVAGFPMTM
jgi:hypothetical protein